MATYAPRVINHYQKITTTKWVKTNLNTNDIPKGLSAAKEGKKIVQRRQYKCFTDVTANTMPQRRTKTATTTTKAAKLMSNWNNWKMLWQRDIRGRSSERTRNHILKTTIEEQQQQNTSSIEKEEPSVLLIPFSQTLQKQQKRFDTNGDVRMLNQERQVKETL